MKRTWTYVSYDKEGFAKYHKWVLAAMFRSRLSRSHVDLMSKKGYLTMLKDYRNSRETPYLLVYIALGLSFLGVMLGGIVHSALQISQSSKVSEICFWAFMAFFITAKLNSNLWWFIEGLEE